MSSNLIIIAVVASGLVFLLVLFKVLKKGAKIAAKLPTNFLAFFLVFALLGLFGFTLQGQISNQPILLGILLLMVSVTGGVLMTHSLYEKWEWSIEASFSKKLLYLLGIALTSVLSFALVFLLCEHRGFPKSGLRSDLVWPLVSIIPAIILPFIFKHLHTLWNQIPKISQVKPIFKLPIGANPPFIETGGPTINFMFIIPLEYQSNEVVKSKVALPFNKTLEEAFHYKLHEHNIVKRLAKKIVFAEGNKRAKVYGWCFYQVKPIWWGWFTKKYYLDPASKLGGTISKGEAVFVERVKIWK